MKITSYAVPSTITAIKKETTILQEDIYVFIRIDLKKATIYLQKKTKQKEMHVYCRH
jgi:hypothetical protein